MIARGKNRFFDFFLPSLSPQLPNPPVLQARVNIITGAFESASIVFFTIELLSKATPQNTKSTKFAFNVFDGTAILQASHFIELAICVFLVKLNFKKTLNLFVYN